MSFQDLLSQNMDEVKEPMPLPPGTYTLTVVDMEQGESAKKHTPFIQFNYTVADIGPDVDSDDLEEAGGTESVIGKKIRDQFYLTEGALFRLKNFLEACGHDVEGKTFAELLPETSGCSVNAYISQRPNDDGTKFYAEIKSYAVAE